VGRGTFTRVARCRGQAIEVEWVGTVIDEQQSRVDLSNNEVEVLGSKDEVEVLRRRIAELEADKAHWQSAEEQRLISEARFASIFADSPIGIVVYDHQGRLLDANANALRYLGLRDMQLLENSNLFDSPALTPDRRAMLDAGQPVRERTTVNFDEARRKIGNLRRTGIAHLEWVIVPAGRFGFLLQIHDVTDQVKAELRLQEREKLFRGLFDALPYPTILWRHTENDDYVLEMYNAMANELAQGRLTEFVGVSVDEFHSHAPDFPQRIRSVFETGDVVRTEQPYILRTTGEEHWVRTSAARVGENYVVDSMTDLSELKRVESALRASESRYRWLAENAPDVIYHVTYQPEPRFDFVSPAVTEILGYTPEEFMAIEDYAHVLLHPDDLQNIKDLRQGSAQSEPQQLRWRHKNGEYVWLEHRFVAEKDESGNLVSGEGVARDVTERVRVRQVLEQALEEKELLIREIHHRVKNNLAIVSGLLDLQTATTEDELVRSTLLTSQKRILAVARLHEILYRSPDVGQINLAQYIRTLSAELCNALGTSDVLVEYDLARVKVPAQQAVYLGLILNELLSNAFKHAFSPGTNGGKGAVRVTLHTTREGTEISVGDNGVGLPPDFDRRSTRSLGLQVISLLTEQLGAALTYESAPGTGTTFKLVLAA
jgi:PAS domain S-box-containing protein